MTTRLWHFYCRRAARRTAAKLALLSTRFARLLPAHPRPARSEFHWGPHPGRLVLLLPGIDDIPEDFARRGMIRDIERHGLGSGAIAVDAHYGYYASRTLHDILDEEVIAPARGTGYRGLILIGVSLGGFGAITYAQRFPEHVAGVLLLAPYLGSRALIREITEAGGLKQWEPGAAGEHDYERRLWAWIKREYGERDGHGRIPLYLGYGNRDWMAYAHRLLATVIPPERVHTTSGGHNWKTWTALWQHLLPRMKKDSAAGHAEPPGRAEAG